MTLLRLGAMLRDRRGTRGVRELAAEIGISPATLSRVEGGKLPDLVTFRKICAWLKVDPRQILGLPGAQEGSTEPSIPDSMTAAVHLRADAQLSQEAAGDLAALILAAQRELASRVRDGRADVPSWV